MDESGMISAFGGDPDTVVESINSGTVASAPPPTTQPNFDTQGAPGDVKGVLGGTAQVISAAGQAVIGFQTAQSAAAVNSAIAGAAQAQTLQSIATQGKLATLQNATQLAQAQAAFNKAAGVPASSSSLVMIVAIAGLVLAALQLEKKG